MLKKLAYIADLSDQYGYHGLANDADQLIKEAGLWTAIKELFTGYDKSLWKRLQRGWARGEFDKNFRISIQLVGEREQLNKKIIEMAQPLKDLKEQVDKFYEQIVASNGQLRPKDFKSELSRLQDNIKSAQKALRKNDLKNALEERTKLQKRLEKALKSIEGFDQGTKDKIISLMKGEPYSSEQGVEKAIENVEKTEPSKTETSTKPSVSEQPKVTPAPTQAPEVVKETTPIAAEAEEKPSDKKIKDIPAETRQAMFEWLVESGIKQMAPGDGVVDVDGAGDRVMRSYFDIFGVNPIAVNELLEGNGALNAEGLVKFKWAFSELRRQAKTRVIYDKQWAEGVHKNQVKPEYIKELEEHERLDKLSPGEKKHLARLRAEKAGAPLETPKPPTPTGPVPPSPGVGPASIPHVVEPIVEPAQQAHVAPSPPDKYVDPESLVAAIKDKQELIKRLEDRVILIHGAAKKSLQDKIDREKALLVDLMSAIPPGQDLESIRKSREVREKARYEQQKRQEIESVGTELGTKRQIIRLGRIHDIRAIFKK
jgi:hypothetical protein